MRPLLAVMGAVLFVATGIALRVAFPRRAAAAPPPAVPVVDASMFAPRTLRLLDRGEGELKGIEPSAALPAINTDGTEIVTFRQSEPLTTLRFFSAHSGRILASYELASPDLSPSMQRARIDAAKMRLEQTSWRALQRGSIVGSRYQEVSMYFPRQGVTIRVKGARRDQLQFEGALWQARSVALPPMGLLAAKRSEPCGSVEGYAEAYLDPALGALLLEPDATFGGKECIAQPAIDQMFVVGLR